MGRRSDLFSSGASRTVRGSRKRLEQIRVRDHLDAPFLVLLLLMLLALIGSWLVSLHHHH